MIDDILAFRRIPPSPVEIGECHVPPSCPAIAPPETVDPAGA